MEIELQELQKAIDEVKDKLVNSGKRKDMNEDQIEAVEHLLDQNEDVNQASDILDIAAKVRRFDLKKRNKRFKQKVNRRYSTIKIRSEGNEVYV